MQALIQKPKYFPMRTCKTFLFLIAFLLTGTLSWSQDCNTFYHFVEDATYEYGHYDKKGKLEAREIQTLSNITTPTDGVVEADMSMKMISEKKNEETFQTQAKIRCEDGVIQLDMAMMISGMMAQFENMDVTIEGEGMELPNQLEVGQTLPDATTEVKTAMNGLNLMTVTISITDRKVEGKETITTPAGTFECFKIRQTSTVKTIMKKSFESVDYLAPGTGMVRSDTFAKNGKLDSRRELLSLKK